MSYFSRLLGYLSTIIHFKDINVKEALLASSDINPDGTREITYNEAKNSNITVAMIQSALNSDYENNPNLDIISFEEFQYFTSLSYNFGSHLFRNCSNLKYIKFPKIKNDNIHKITINGVDLLGNTAIEKLDLIDIEYISGPTGYSDDNGYNSLFGKMTSLKEVWIPDLMSIFGNGFRSHSVPNVEKVVISSINQWLNITITEGANQHPNILPTSGGKASLYEITQNGLQKITRITTTGVTALRNNIFNGIQDIVEITIAEENTTVGDYVFANLGDSNNYILINNYNNIISIGDGAFINCYAHGISNVPTSAKSIGSAYTHSTLEKIESDELETIGGLIASYSTISKIKADSVTSIGSSGSNNEGPFKSCTNLLTVSMKGLTSLPHYSFYGCSNLITVDLTSCIEIKWNAFTNCTSLVSFTAPNLIKFGAKCFQMCYNLSVYNFDLTHAVEIDIEAFSGNGNKSMKIQMPCHFYDLTKIGDLAFAYCIAPTENYIVLHRTSQIVTYVPYPSFSPYNINTFAGVRTIYVPDDLVSTYIADSNWSNMVNLGITFIGISQLPV